jgi:uncharacterized protein (DUF1800 family)
MRPLAPPLAVFLLLVQLDAAAVRGDTRDQWTGDLSPLPAASWSYDLAAHLLERAGFGGTPEEVQKLAAMTPRDAVRHLVYYQQVEDAALPPFRESGIFPAPDWSPRRNAGAFRHILFGTLDSLPPAQRALLMSPAMTGVTPEDRRTAKTDKQAVVDKFYYWRWVDIREMARAETWLGERMLLTHRPLQEKLVLFWHGHFATSNEKVRDYRKMLGQFAMLREHANGNLRDLLVGIAQDPAMLVYLDNHQNVKGHPNENFAREIFELFSLGVGNYTETDIKEAARAFTGWTLDPGLMKYVNRPDLHDEGTKTVLGTSGHFDGYDLIDVILEQEATARFIGGKLYRFFVREDPGAELENELAVLLRRHEYEIAPFLEQIFLSRDFYSTASSGTQIKSPVHLLISTYRKLGLVEMPTTPDLASMTGGLGQRLFQPPNVKGWDGGRTWINPSTLFQRQNMARYVLFPEEIPVIEDAHLEGSRRLSGDYVHEQFLASAARGDYTSFPTGGTMGRMGEGGMDETARLNAEDFNLFRGVFNGVSRAYQRVPPAPRIVPDFRIAALLEKENVTSPASAVDALLRRFMLLPIDAVRRAELVRFAEAQLGGGTIDWGGETVETGLRELLHLILSLPEYQLA